MREELGQLCHPDGIERCKTRYIELFSSHLEQDPAAIPPIPGAHQFIEHLEDSDQYMFAVATAGWSFTAELKLTAAGFDFDDWILYSCSDYEYKKEAMKAAHQAARQKQVQISIQLSTSVTLGPTCDLPTNWATISWVEAIYTPNPMYGVFRAFRTLRTFVWLKVKFAARSRQVKPRTSELP